MKYVLLGVLLVLAGFLAGMWAASPRGPDDEVEK